MRKILAVLTLVVIAVGTGSCGDQDLMSPEVPGPQFAISDAAHEGENPDFFFLPPLVPDPVGHVNFDEGEFNSDVKPVVFICELEVIVGNPLATTECDPDAEALKIEFTMNTGPGSETVRLNEADEHYIVNWHTDEFALDLDRFYRIHVRVGATPLGFADVDPLSNGRELRNVNTDEVIGLVDGRTLPIKFRIENGALCDPPGTTPCASATFDLADGGSVVLEETGDRVDLPPQATLPEGVTEVTVTMQLCDGIDVDLPTFGNCLEITSDPALDETTAAGSGNWDGLFPRAVISVCSLIDSSELPADPQRDLITLHRQNDDDVQALPHAHSFCEGEAQSASLWQGGFRSLASRGLDLLRQGVARIGGPRPLHARGRALRLDVGHAGESPFLSKFQFALPAEMEIDETTNGQTTGAGGTVSPAPTVIVKDRDGGPVAGATVRFEVDGSGGSLSPDAGLTVISGADGRASIADAEEGAGTWTLGGETGTYRLRAFGFGIAGSGDDGPFMPELPSETETEQNPVTLETGEVIFTAAVCESEPCAVGTIDLTEGGSVILEATGDRVDIPAQDPNAFPDGVTEVTITLELCDGIDVDLPTFGNCLRITSDPELTEDTFVEWGGLSPRAIISMCSVELEGDPALDALTDPQRDMVTLHRERNGLVQALPHADDECPTIIPESAWSGENASLAQRGLSALQRGVAFLAGAKPLLASGRRLRLDVGHAGESPFLSNFQLALPAMMEIVEGTDGQTADAGFGVEVPPKVYVSDRDGNAVLGATVHFEVTGGGGTIDEGSSLSVTTGSDGVAAVASWVLGAAAGTNTVKASGRGIADPTDDGPFMPALASDEPAPEEPPDPVELGTGEVSFTALGLGLVSHWTGDGTFEDAVGPNHGVADPLGSVGFADGIVGQAFQFQGDSAFVDAPGTNIDDADHITIMGWVRMDSEAPLSRIERFVTLTGEKAVVRHDGEASPGQLHFFTRIGGNLHHIRVDGVLQTGCFQHFAGTYDGTVMRAYLDGTEVGSLEVPGALDTGEGVELSSLAQTVAGLETLDGLLDEVEIHNRALTAAEIQASFGAPGSAGTCALLAPTGTVQGTVTDATTQEPIPGAQVHVVGTGLGALTDEIGRYELNHVPAGSQTIRVTMIGYADQEQEVEVADGMTTPTDFSLLPISAAVARAVSKGYEGVLAVYSAVSDELDRTGSSTDFDQLSRGHLNLAWGTTTTPALEDLIVAQRLADEAVEELDAEADPMGLAGVLVWKALAYLTIADMFEDWVLEAGGMAVGPENMLQLYQDAVAALTEAHTLAVAHEPESFLTLLSMALRARAHFSHEVWGKARNPDQEPVIVGSTDAVASAHAALELAGGADFTSTIGSGESGIAVWRAAEELDFGATYWTGSSVAILDPISEGSSPIVGTIIDEVLSVPPALRIVSGAEMRLIIAEHELAVGNLSAFTDAINAIRTNEGLPPTAPATDSEARELLIHMRQTYSYLQGRRLADHYRFGVLAPTWDEGSVAATAPGTFLPFPFP